MQPLRYSVGCAAALLLSTHALANGGDIPPALLQGRASAWAAAVVVNDASPQSGSQVRIKLAGNQSAFPAAAPLVVGSWAPSYAMTHLSSAFAGIEIDAHSSGNAWIPHLNSNGVPELVDRWLAVTVSVSSTSTGANNSPWSRGTSANRHAGSDLVSYYFDGSVGVSPMLVGNIAQETSREDFGFATGSNADIAALDYGLGVNTVSQAPNRLFPRQDDYFFSVSKAWADSWNTANSSSPPSFASRVNSSVMHRPHPGAVYRVIWNGSLWSAPILYLSATELGLSPATGDIDALEVSPGTRMVMFSATPTSGFDTSATTDLIGPADQIMLFEEGMSGSRSTVRELKHSSGGSNDLVRKRLKLGNQAENNVDALCAIDPEQGVADICPAVGSPTTQWSAYGRPMGMSVVRRQSSSPNIDDLVFQVTGWGQTVPVNGQVILFKHVGPMVPGPQGIPSSGWSYETVVPVQRLSSDQVLEIVRERDLNTLSTQVETSFMAVQYNAAGTRVGASLVLTMLDHQ